MVCAFLLIIFSPYTIGCPFVGQISTLSAPAFSRLAFTNSAVRITSSLYFESALTEGILNKSISSLMNLSLLEVIYSWTFCIIFIVLVLNFQFKLQRSPSCHFHLPVYFFNKPL